MLKLQYFDHLMQRANAFEKTLMLGKIESRRRKGWQRMRCLDGIIDSMDMSLSKLQETVNNRESGHIAIHGVSKSRTWPSNWTSAWWANHTQDCWIWNPLHSNAGFLSLSSRHSAKFAGFPPLSPPLGLCEGLEWFCQYAGVFVFCFCLTAPFLSNGHWKF